MKQNTLLKLLKEHKRNCVKHYLDYNFYLIYLKGSAEGSGLNYLIFFDEVENGIMIRESV